MSTSTLSACPVARWLRSVITERFSATDAPDAAIVANARRQSIEAEMVFMEIWEGKTLGLEQNP
jgi:hypothetical protein